MKMLQLILSSILLLGVELAHAAPHPSLKYITHVERAEQIQSEYDYVIVGAGTAGLTVGDRLTEDGRCMCLVWCLIVAYTDSDTKNRHRSCD